MQSYYLKMVLSNSPDEGIYERNETNKGNKFGSSGGNKSKEEKASKGEEGRKISKKHLEQQRQNKEWRIYAELTTEEVGRGGSV